MAKDLKFNLLENAIDSLQQGIRFALEEDSPTQGDLKLSVLLVAQSVELLLKERLRKEHWSLIFTKIDEAGKLDANTVTIPDSIKRLEQIVHVKLDDEEKRTILLLSNTRNRIQHYEIEISFEEVLGKIHAAIAFVTRFLKDELQKDISDHLQRSYIRELMDIDKTLKPLQDLAQQSIEKLRKEHEPADAKDRINWQFRVMDCPECWQEYYVFSLSEDISQCQLCKYKGGFIQCIRCNKSGFSGDSIFRFSSEPDYAICNNCWENETEKSTFG